LENDTINNNGKSKNNISLEDNVTDDPLRAFDSTDKKKENSTINNNDNKEDVLSTIESALAELKLVKDALLGNLDETQ